MTFLCPMLLLLNALSQDIPLGARFVYSTNNLDVFEKERLMVTLRICRTPFKILGEYPGFLRLEKVRNHPLD